MKKIFTHSIAAFLVALLFTSCVKEKIVYDDRSYWLSQERADVVYSSNSCGVYVVETNYGYTIIQNLDGFSNYEGDVVYGNFGGYGTRDFFNYTANTITRGNVLEYDLSYNAATDAIDYYCPLGRASGFKLRQPAGSKSKISRTNATVK